MMARRLVIVGGIAVVFFLVIISIAYRAIPQPIIEIKGETLWEVGPLPIRNTLLTSWAVVVLLVTLAYFSGRNLKWIPSGWQNFIETVVEGIHSLVVNTAGETYGRRFFWVIATFLIYITVSNWFALLPIFNAVGKVEPLGPAEGEFHEHAVVVQSAGISLINFRSKLIDIEVDEAACDGMAGEEKAGCVEHARTEAIATAREENNVGDDEELAILAPYFRSVNTDLMSPLALAIASAIFVEYWGISTLGVLAYGGKFFNVRRLRRGNLMGILDLFVGVLEFIAEVARLISFTFRLFGNMLAGEILLLVMTFLLPFAFVILSGFYGLEIFVGLIQAFVFGMLTLVFGVLAVSEHGGDHAEEGGH
ncbi:MAG: F0F1 ATP synthase subunit A [Dehalococcoidia bacterium]